MEIVHKTLGVPLSGLKVVYYADDAPEFENKSMRIPFLCTVDQIKKLESLLKVESAFCC